MVEPARWSSTFQVIQEAVEGQHCNDMFVLCLALQIDPRAARTTSQGLSPFGIKCYAVSTLKDAQRMLSQWRFDLILVNGVDFTEVLPSLLARLSSTRVPIVLATSGEDEARSIRYLESGASALVDSGMSSQLTAVKLMRLAELRCETKRSTEDEIQVGELVLEPRRMAARFGDTPLRLTPHLFQVLLLLALNPGEFVHRQTLAGLVRSTDTRSVDMTISRLRRVLQAFERWGLSIETMVGRGYRLQVQEVAAPVTLAWVS